MAGEALRKAQRKYRRKVRQFVVHFYLKDRALYEAAREKAAANGGINAYVKGLIRADLEK